MSSTPSRPYTLEITVKRVPGGLVSNWLCDELKPGDELTVKGPAGKFSCFQQPSDKLLLIGAGSGITPIMSMARWLMDTGADIDVDLLASFHSERDFIFRSEFDLMASRCNNIRTAFTISSDSADADGSEGYTGRINTALINEFTPDVDNRHIFLCGPEAFMEAVKKMLRELDFPMENLHSESFASGHVEQGKHIETLKKELNQNAKYQLVLDKTGLTIPANDQFSILELLEMHGVEMDYSCRIGHCGECMVKCLAGEVEMGGEAEIDSSDREKGWVYGCCTYPRSDVVLDL
jgi:ferredoxin-NADP reductase